MVSGVVCARVSAVATTRLGPLRIASSFRSFITMAPSKRTGSSPTARSPAKRAAVGDVPGVEKPGADHRAFSSKSGEFVRQQSSFRNFVRADGSTDFLPERDRYHLYVSHACPWAHRTMIYRTLKGLEDVITVSVVHHEMTEQGWRFLTPGEDVPGATVDTVCGAARIRDIYLAEDPGYTARFTVPVLFDKKLKRIVNNESSEIIRMLDVEFNEFAKNPKLTLYPKELRSKIDAINEWVYPEFNNGVYRAGFASVQSAYEAAYKQVFDALDKTEKILSKSKYLTGDTLTEADIRFFTTAIRFDPVYHTHFKCTGGTIANNYPNILKLVRRIYQTGKVKDTVYMDHIKKHYYCSHIHINPTRIVPVWDGADLTVPVKD